MVLHYKLSATYAVGIVGDVRVRSDAIVQVQLLEFVKVNATVFPEANN